MKQNLFLKLIMLGIISFVCVKHIHAQTYATQVTQYGITWAFSSPKQIGKFANGDYWVLGPVTITNITPSYTVSGTTKMNGWEVNPSNIINQGFDSRIANFTVSLVPTLPYVAAPGSSIVKTVSKPTSTNTNHSALLDAAVLTVLGSVPIDSGVTSFRPPYFGTNKPLISIHTIDTTLLPQLPPVINQPHLDSIAKSCQRVHLDHKFDWVGRNMHPNNNMPMYGSEISIRNSEAALRFMIKGTGASKWKALINYLQMAIDLHYMNSSNAIWTSNGGHLEGRKLPIAFAGWIMHNTAFKDSVKYAGIEKFGENGGVYYSSTANKVLFGQYDLSPTSELNYWKNIMSENTVTGTLTSARTTIDPYNYIDGGSIPGSSYQLCCLSLPWKSSALSAFMICDIKDTWNNQNHLDYVDRWAASGAYTQPDPCAPVDFSDSLNGPHPMLNYGVTYGPNGTGGCILDTNPSDGIGRFPAKHNTNVNSGGYYNYFTFSSGGQSFSEKMWLQYRAYGNAINYTASANPSVSIGSSTTFSLNVDTSECVISWNNGSYTKNMTYVLTPMVTTTVNATIKYKNGLGCPVSHPFVVTVNNPAGLKEYPKTEIVIMPNPTDGIITIYGLQPYSGNETKVSIYDICGRNLYSSSQKINVSADLFTINLSELNIVSGIYFIDIESSNHFSKQKLVYMKK